MVEANRILLNSTMGRILPKQSCEVSSLIPIYSGLHSFFIQIYVVRTHRLICILRRAELFDKKIVSEIVHRNDKIMTNYKMKTLLEFCRMSLKNAYCEFWKKNL